MVVSRVFVSDINRSWATVGGLLRLDGSIERLLSVFIIPACRETSWTLSLSVSSYLYIKKEGGGGILIIHFYFHLFFFSVSVTVVFLYCFSITRCPMAETISVKHLGENKGPTTRLSYLRQPRSPFIHPSVCACCWFLLPYVHTAVEVRGGMSTSQSATAHTATD